MNHPEYDLQCLVVKYLNAQYPNVLFYSDTIASIKLTKAQAGRNAKIQKKGFKMPDLIILHPNKIYFGLMIELKISSPYKKDGKLLKNEHLEGQEQTIRDLNHRGYFSCFAWSFEQTKEIIDNYMKIH
jgi:hypothetical protein